MYVSEVILHVAPLVLRGDRFAGMSSWNLNQPPGPTQPLRVFMVRHNKYWQLLQPLVGMKQQVLHGSILYCHDCWHAECWCGRL